MCILIAKPKNTPLPSFEALHNSYLNNPDGCGYAVPGKVFHSLDFQEFYYNLMQEDPALPMIIHFRWATHGSVNVNNCHPFYNPKTGISFAHNGILPIDAIGDKTDSETAFITRFLPAIHRDNGSICGPQLRAAVGKIIGSSKFAFLDKEGNMHTFGPFITDNGCLYSNSSYRYARHFAFAK